MYLVLRMLGRLEIIDLIALAESHLMLQKHLRLVQYLKEGQLS